MKKENIKKLQEATGLLQSKMRTSQSLKLKRAIELIGEVYSTEVPDPEPVTIEDEIYGR